MLLVTKLLLIYVRFLFLVSHYFALSIEEKENTHEIISLNIQNADSGQTIPSTMHGVILETNVNRNDDGGLYAELIYNRAFQGLKYRRYI